MLVARVYNVFNTRRGRERRQLVEPGGPLHRKKKTKPTIYTHMFAGRKRKQKNDEKGGGATDGRGRTESGWIGTTLPPQSTTRHRNKGEKIKGVRAESVS